MIRIRFLIESHNGLRPPTHDALKAAQRGSLDYTDWLHWYLGCLDRAFAAASDTVVSAMYRNRFWQMRKDKKLNERQL